MAVAWFRFVVGMERCGLIPEIFWRWKQELGDRLDLGVREWQA